MWEQIRHIATMTQKVHAVENRDQTCIAFQLPALRSVANDQHMDIISNGLHQVGCPNEIANSLLRPEPADCTDEVNILGKTKLPEQLRPGKPAGRCRRHTIGDENKLLRLKTTLDVKISRAGAVDHNPFGRPGEEPIDRQVMPALPQINASFAGNHMGHPCLVGSRAAVAIGRKEPCLHKVGFELADQTNKTAVSPRVHLKPLVDFMNRNTDRREDLTPRAPSGHSAHVNLKFIAVGSVEKTGGQQRQLFLSTTTIQGGNQV